ncbi:hypothetical protein KCH_63550 [Kitasatospora cheerisanensis KCTC 2395]|uniref:Uncharacterized protein n=1 Tax=Kitasatospora cheerisanensis KCTC 2395 TaxID=1348663 RepID=A0A066YUY9_9ACTN|nr:hypothetical protein KCH_63550 [Kitasatospora cheerisanensis KCTC 2395]
MNNWSGPYPPAGGLSTIEHGAQSPGGGRAKAPNGARPAQRRLCS